MTIENENENQDEAITNAINNITEKLSHALLQEFLKLPEALQVNIILIKSAQLLLANVLCHVAMTKDELDNIADAQGAEMKELTLNCAFSGFMEKFDMSKH
jgi:hypothetical protein